MKKSAKHGGNRHRIELTEFALASNSQPDRLLELNDALDLLVAKDEPAATVAKMRLFAAMPLEDVALSLGLSRTVVHRQWTYARDWLKR